MHTILITAPYILPHLERFKPVFEHYNLQLIVPQVNERLKEDELMVYAGEFDAAICGDDHYSEQVLSACAPRLKVLSKWGTGIDSIDQDAAERLGIQVMRTPNAFTMPVADSVMGYILAFARRQPWMDKAMKSGRWEKLTGRSLAECTLGVIGVGNCGKAVLRRARGFGMELIGNDIIEIPQDFVIETNVEMTTLDDLLSRCDFVSLNCDLNPTSYHLINADTLKIIKTDAVLINTSRGQVIDETALIESLNSGQLSGAALDVFEHEPLPKDSPLIKYENVLLAPHNANSSPMASERVHWNTLRNLLSVLEYPLEDLDMFAVNSRRYK